MEKFSLAYDDLMNFPYEKYLEFQKIMAREAKEEKEEQAKAEKQANTGKI